MKDQRFKKIKEDQRTETLERRIKGGQKIRRSISEDQTNIKIGDQVSVKEDYLMINVEREYKFHDQSGARVQKRHNYQREAKITINFPGEQ